MRRIEQNLYLGDISVFKQDLSDYSHLFIMSRDELGDEQSNAENYLFIDLIDDDEVSETEFV